jgi:hypothetical protein
MNPILSAPRTIFVHVERPSPRATYALRHLVERLLGWKFVQVSSRQEWETANGPKLLYGTALHIQAAFLPNTGALEGMTPRTDPEVASVHGLPVLFAHHQGVVPFDLPAALFWHLSCIEEMGDLATDAHGRPVTSALFAARHGYLHRPLVDEWALHFASAWRLREESVPEPIRHYRSVFTMDVDNGFAYAGRPFWRWAGAQLRAVLNERHQEAAARREVLAGRAKDPFDVYAEVEQWTDGLCDRRILFWLAAPRGKYDHAVAVDHPVLRERLKTTTRWSETGLHPSYRTAERPKRITQERERLALVVEKPILLSRQHFLRTLRLAPLAELAAMGMQEDHSLGVHDQVGFRASTCTPFPWYHVQEERETELMLWPHTIMDNTLRQKLGLTPEEALKVACNIVDRVRQVRGTFIGLWHESYLSDHLAAQGWRRTILETTHHAKP